MVDKKWDTLYIKFCKRLSKTYLKSFSFLIMITQRRIQVHHIFLFPLRTDEMSGGYGKF